MRVSGTNITMTRGDSELITVSCKTSLGTLVPFVTGDKVYLTIKTSIYDTEKILQKIISTFTNGVALIQINPIDTKSLEFMPYIYDVQLTRADGSIVTLIQPSKFIIGGEVTYE